MVEVITKIPRALSIRSSSTLILWRISFQKFKPSQKKPLRGSTRRRRRRERGYFKKTISS